MFTNKNLKELIFHNSTIHATTQLKWFGTTKKSCMITSTCFSANAQKKRSEFVPKAVRIRTEFCQKIRSKAL